MSMTLSDVPACLLSSESTEWFTPSRYIEAARLIMGGIDIDPASCELANQMVRATAIYTKETNGYDKRWYGRVWLNPPYGHDDKKGNQARWSARLIEQYQAGITTQAVLLVNAVTDRKWFQPLWNYPICFCDHRIAFYTSKAKEPAPTHGNVLVYFGSHVEEFSYVFSQFGHVVKPQEVDASTTLWGVSA